MTTSIARLRDQRPVRLQVRSGRLALDRLLPYLTVYRGPRAPRDRGTAKLIAPVAARALAPTQVKDMPAFEDAIRALAAAAIEDFGAFLLIELWADASLADERNPPAFRIHACQQAEHDPVIACLRSHLGKIDVGEPAVRVDVARTQRWAIADEPRLLRSAAPQELVHLGLAVRPVYRDPASGAVYPRVLRELSRQISSALQRTVYKFSCSQTTSCPRDFHMLGRRAVTRSVWAVDRQLAEISEQFDFLLQVSPTNATSAWEMFKARSYSHEPTFHYRPSPIDPSVLRRALFAAPIERVDDPTLAGIFRSKQTELDLQIGLLDEIGTRQFTLGGMRLYGEVDPSLLSLARQLVKRCPVGTGRDDTTGGTVDEEALATLARAEIERYRVVWPGFGARVEVRADVGRGLMVSHGVVLIGRGTRVPRRRVDALLQHEVGTHALTYYNARSQRLRLLASGFSDYDAFQEGLGVVAEYLVDGLSLARLRLLGARVLGVNAMLGGASFVETYRLLTQRYGFESRTAFNVTVRIYRGGGLTKDAIYLRGVVAVLEYLGSGGEIEPLAVGKIAPEHVPLIHELELRGILSPPPVLPLYLQRPESRERIALLRGGLSVLDLVKQAPF